MAFIWFKLFLQFRFNKDKLLKWDKKQNIPFAGVNCGIMDQLPQFSEKQCNFLRFDTLDYQYAPADFGDYTLLLLNTNVKHNLQTSEYNNRRKEFEAGISIIKNKYQKFKILEKLEWKW